MAVTRHAPHRAPGPWVITGAASGFGLEFARRLSHEGRTLALWDRDEAGLARAVASLGPLAAERVTTHAVDVRDADSVRSAARETVARVGAVRGLVHCAGVLRVGPIERASDEDLRTMIEVNYLGTAHVVRALLPSLRDRGSTGDGPAVMVLVSSVAGLRGFADLGGYSASKHAVAGFAQALRDELAAERAPVEVKLLCPPPADTPMVRNLAERPAVYKLSRMFSAEQVVDEALRALEKPEWRVLVGLDQRALVALERVAPGVFDLGMRAALRLLR